MALTNQIEIDYNLLENIIRPVAIRRKNYLFAGSHESAQRSIVRCRLPPEMPNGGLGASNQ